MAASDPTPYVATPTGTLQGVAAFSWDGSAWQPTGRAGPDVATPTGVLQGVAPFSYDGANWQPSGRPQPGVATPSGVLDGVAVYTWSGSAWTPTGGTASPSTPSGALRGVAAFSWDGAAWQPAAQAGASVPTPYGVLYGVAFFNWGGSAWQAGGAVPSGATLDLSFLSGTLDPRITFTRASTATYFDATGTLQTAATNAPRFDYDPVTHALRGLLIEEARTNVLLNSATLGTQSVTTTAVATTLSFYGTGTVTLSGTSTAGPLTGTGATNRVSLTFTPTAGTLTLTVTGSVLSAQLEVGSFSTSWIPTTAAAATRAVELATMPTAAWYNATAGTIVSEMLPQLNGNANQDWPCLTAGDATNLYNIRTSATNAQCIVFVANANVGGPAAANLVTFGVRTSIGVSYDAGTRAVTLGLNGGTPATVTASSLPVVNSIQMGLSRTTNPNCWHRRVRYWPRVLSSAELQSATT